MRARLGEKKGVWYGMVWYGMVWYGMVWVLLDSFVVHFSQDTSLCICVCGCVCVCVCKRGRRIGKEKRHKSGQRSLSLDYTDIYCFSPHTNRRNKG